jgi:hydroxyacyl-ACP dehydratase HTD2-like protein with hotdog domain
VFRRAIPVPSESEPPSAPPSPSTSHIATPNPTSSVISTEGKTHTRTLVQTPVTLFRFSALTFNPHKIHYSLPWARDVEGHKDIVVHGPLNLISILDLWRDIRSQDVTDPSLVVPERISYRATSPLYAGDEYRVVLEEGEETKVQIIGPGGVVAMKAEIH